MSPNETFSSIAQCLLLRKNIIKKNSIKGYTRLEDTLLPLIQIIRNEIQQEEFHLRAL